MPSPSSRTRRTSSYTPHGPPRPGRPIGLVLLVALLVLAGALLFFLNQTTAEHSADVPGFAPLRDAALARAFAPEIAAGEYGAPEELFYRLSRAEDGGLHLAYFAVWPYEANPGEGWGPWLSRNLYTGGLGSQGVLFGPGDVEVIALELRARRAGNAAAAEAPTAPGEGEGVPEEDRKALKEDRKLLMEESLQKLRERYRVVRLEFETARNYDPAAFAVQHRTVALPDQLEEASARAAIRATLQEPLVLRVLSWNHMFELLVGEAFPGELEGLRKQSEAQLDGGPLALEPEYFRPELWEHYRMFKARETRLSKNRAHPPFAREAVSRDAAPVE